MSLFPFQKKWQVCHWTSPVISVSHASLFVGLVLAWTTSPPAKEVLHLYRWFTHTHTCSETSYRITEVECISRAKNNPLKLTGMFGRFEVRNLSEVFLRLSSDAAQNNCSFLTTSAENQIVETVQLLCSKTV